MHYGPIALFIVLSTSLEGPNNGNKSAQVYPEQGNRTIMHYHSHLAIEFKHYKSGCLVRRVERLPRRTQKMGTRALMFILNTPALVAWGQKPRTSHLSDWINGQTEG